MLRTRILAAATATLLALGMAAGGASPALASNTDNSNNPDYWETLTGEVCYDAGYSTEDADSNPFVLGANTEGYMFSKVIIKAGSGDGSNTVYTEDMDGGTLSEGDTFVHGIKDSISHTIVCEVPLPKVASGSIDITAATCELGGSLNVAGFTKSNADFVVVDDGSGDGTFEVVFTVVGNALFPVTVDGGVVSENRTVLTYTGSLSPPDLSKCPIAMAEIDFTAPTCTTGEQLNEDGFESSNTGEPEITIVGSSYEVVFTATGTALFPAVVEGAEVSDDRTTLTYSGTLDGPNLEDCPIAMAEIDFTAPTCTTGEQLNEDGFESSNTGEPEITIVGSSYEVVFTATGTALFPAVVEGAEVSDDRTTLTYSGTLDPKNEQLCVVVDASFTLPPATCEVGEDWENPIIDADAGVTYGEPEFDPETQTVSITFLATGANVFQVEVEGETTFVKTLKVTIDVAGPDQEDCLDAVAAIAVTDADCFFDSTLDEDNFTDENATYAITVYNPETREYEVVFTADYGHRFDTSLDGVSEDGKTRTFSGTLDGAIEGEECVLPITDAFLAFEDATCVDAQSLDVDGFDFDTALAALESVTYDGLDYEVVFVAIGEDTQFFQSDEPVEGRTVSEDGTVLTFTGTLDGPNEELCLEAIVPPVTVVDDCFTQSYTITAVDGVSYTRTVNDLELPVSFGEGDSVTYSASPFDTVTVTASAEPGYLLSEEYEAFEYTYAFDEDCLPTAPVTTASVTWTQADCLGNPGSYTLTNEPGVIWTVDGVVVAGNTKYTAAIGSTPSIVASLEPASEEFPTGFGWSDEDQRTLWNLVFAAAEDCLPTLALTGASNALGGLGVIAILIMMAGTGLVVARRREAVRIQG